MKIAALALAGLLSLASTTALAVDTFVVTVRGLWIEPRGIDTPRPAVVYLDGPVPQYVDLRYVTGLRYQVQGASCGRTDGSLPCVPYGWASTIMLEVSFDNGATWSRTGANVSLTPTEVNYTPPLKPTELVKLPQNMRKNNAIFRNMVDYIDGNPVISEATVQFYN